MIQTLYSYHPVTGEFTGTAIAEESPLEPGVLLLPVCTTQDAPLVAPAGKVAVFTEGVGWALADEVRGTWYNAAHESVEITDLGADVTGLTRTQPPTQDHALQDGDWVLTEAAIAARLEANKQAAQSRIDAYFETLYSAAVPNSAIGAEYDAAYLVAKEWLKDTTKPAPERVKALAESYGVTNELAAGVVVQKWTEAQAVAFDQRGAARLRAKLAIRQAVDADGVAAAEAAGRAAMEAVAYTV